MTQSGRPGSVPGASNLSPTLILALTLVLLPAAAGAAPPAPPTPAVTPVDGGAKPTVDCVDLDGDGYSGASFLCGETDADDGDPTVWRWLAGFGDLDGDGHVSASLERIRAGATAPPGFGDRPGDDCNDDRPWAAAGGGDCPARDEIALLLATGDDAADFALHLDADRRLRLWATHFTRGTSWHSDPTNSRDFAYESSADLESWTAGPPALTATGNGAWDADHLWAPSVVQDPVDGRWYMFYAGVGDTRPDAARHRERIGLAVSDDLETWTRVTDAGCAGAAGDGCVFDCDLPWTAWSDTTTGWTHQCRDPHVVRDADGTFYLVYAAATAPFNWQMAIGLAASTDLRHWTDLGPLPGTAGGVAESPHLLRRNGLWYLFWTHARDGGIRWTSAPDVAAGPWTVPRGLADAGWWTGAIASETLDAGDRLLFAYVQQGTRSVAFRGLEFRADGSPRLGPVAPLDCVLVDPAAQHSDAAELPGNGRDDDCDTAVDFTPSRAALCGGETATAIAQDGQTAAWLARWDDLHPGRAHRLAPRPWPAEATAATYATRWPLGTSPPDSAGTAAFDSLCARAGVVVISFDAAASDLLPDAAAPDSTAIPPTPAGARVFCRALRDLVDAHPGTAFLAWTPPPRHALFVPEAGTAEGNARRAAGFAAWLRDSWPREDGRTRPGLHVFDARALLAEEAGLYLRLEWTRAPGDAADSRPNAAGLAALAPRLAQAIINAEAVAAGAVACTDADADGWGANGVPACLRGGVDCNDDAPGVNPGAREICGNATDENCDGAAPVDCGRKPGYRPIQLGADGGPSCWLLPAANGEAARIGLTLARPARARVTLYDLRGARVADLLDEPLATGQRTIAWNGRDARGRPAPAGVYFCLFEADGRRATTKLVLLR